MKATFSGSADDSSGKLRPEEASASAGAGLSGRKILGPLMTFDHMVRSNAWEGIMGFTGSHVTSSGGSLSGATASARERNSELHQGRAIMSPTSSPTSTGRDSNCRGGSISGEITSPKLVNTVRYQGKSRKSPSNIPRFTGREVR